MFGSLSSMQESQPGSGVCNANYDGLETSRLLETWRLIEDAQVSLWHLQAHTRHTKGLKKKNCKTLGIVLHMCNLRLEQWKQDNHEFRVILGCMQVQDQSGLQETLSQKYKTNKIEGLKKKKLK